MPPPPTQVYVGIYWDCEENEWMLASHALSDTKADAAEQAEQWGSPRHVLVARIDVSGWEPR
jgi:hypothetical protein